jgi:type II secretory pathway pseudopilin PulG
MELLIVIGVLGILAAGLLAAIDPFEQLKKARDSNYRSAALELLSATQRYYANHGYFPWTNDGSACQVANNAGGQVNFLDPDVDTSMSAKLLEMGGGSGMGTFSTCLRIWCLMVK